MEPDIWSITLPDGTTFDPVFGLTKHEHPALIDPLWCIVWRDTGEQVRKTGGFLNSVEASLFANKNREEWIRKKMEETLLG